MEIANVILRESISTPPKARKQISLFLSNEVVLLSPPQWENHNIMRREQLHKRYKNTPLSSVPIFSYSTPAVGGGG